jgi:predicted metal-binding protein
MPAKRLLDSGCWPVQTSDKTEKTMNRQTIIKHLERLGATNCQFISTRVLVPEERIRDYCREDKCGRYNRHLTCPPNTGTVQEIIEKLRGFKTGVLIQYFEDVDVENDKEGLRKTKLNLHRIILETEKYLQKELGFEKVWGMIGGNCDLCEECAGYRGEPCGYPEEARASIEAHAIHIVALLEKLGLDTEFRKDRVTWTGIVLTDREI